MSELQISLLALGAFVVLAVYFYGAWQQRRYRNRFGSAFAARRGDVLDEGARTAAAPDAIVEHTLRFAAEPAGNPGEVCQTTGDETDYIAVLFASFPLHPSSLMPLWDRRFDFGKDVMICGVRDEAGSWEMVLPESTQAYATFRISLQLVDRNGAVSETQLDDFSDTVRDLADALDAEANLPDTAESASTARRLDAFCAEVDHMIGLNILPSGGDILFGETVARAAAQLGMSLRADGMFHLTGDDGHTLYTLANFDESAFREDELAGLPVIGLSLQLDVPRVAQPAQRFEEMLALAQALGESLEAEVVDDNRHALDEQGIAKIRAHVGALEKKMRARNIAPGSALARRLFA